MDTRLDGRIAVVTGVSRRQGIGCAIARRLADAGASLFLQHFAPHDVAQPWGGDDIEAVVNDVRAHLAPGARMAHASIDLSRADGAKRLIEKASALGHLDVLVCNHAQSNPDTDLAGTSADVLDLHWRVNARSTILVTQAFASQHDGREGGRVIWMTSGQSKGPMPGEIAYAASKAALAGLVTTVADELIDRGIIVNAVNPGPVDTGYCDVDEIVAAMPRAFPQGRWGVPDDVARLVEWLVSESGRWVVGQVIDSEGGFRRWNLA
ncbi:MAG: SDR family oxidoreductase [Actinomycetaceae bacterium]|nr:SDR family oxidoreductase [Actinomycetaceae bacterium]